MNPEYRTEITELKLDGMSIRLHLIRNIDELFNALIEKGQDHDDVKQEKIPYWAELWPSAIAISEFMIRNDLVTKGMTVTEIGCGLGLPGIVAGKLGARVLFTDYLPEALNFARLNWKENCSGPAEFELMDWKQPDPAFAADLVLASDVAYERKSFKQVLKALQVLCKPGGKILLSEPNRKFAREFIEGFDKNRMEVFSQTVSTFYNKINNTIHIHLISPSKMGI